MGQVLPYPVQPYQAPPQQPQYVYPTTVQQGHYAQQPYLPAFPVLAAQIDTHARKLPWYVWAVGGAYLMFRVLKR
jgi:hypothetical protein